MARVRVPRRRHRHQHPLEERHDVDADDLRAAGVPDAGAAGAARGAVAVARLARPAVGRARRPTWRLSSTAGSSRPTHRSTACVLDPRATYIVVARHPLDMAVSLYHQGDNLDRRRIAELTGQPPRPEPTRRGRRSRRGSTAGSSADGTRGSSSTRCPGCCAHLTDAWARRDEPNVVLVHYDDLSRTSRARCAGSPARLGIEVPEDRWPELVDRGPFELDAGPGRRARA